MKGMKNQHVIITILQKSTCSLSVIKADAILQRLYQ